MGEGIIASCCPYIAFISEFTSFWVGSAVEAHLKLMISEQSLTLTCVLTILTELFENLRVQLGGQKFMLLNLPEKSCSLFSKRPNASDRYVEIHAYVDRYECHGFHSSHCRQASAQAI